MYGLRQDLDLLPFEGLRLVQVCIGENETIFNFDDEVSVNVSSDFRIGTSNGGNLFRTSVSAAAPAASLLGKAVKQAAHTAEGTLTLTFADESVLEIYESSRDYESYQLRISGSIYVV